jgi:HEAT repeat protein
MSFLQGLFGPPKIKKLKHKKDIKGLIKALEYKKDPTVRAGAAEALGQIGDSCAVEPLIAALKDNDRDVRRVMAEALDTLKWQPDKSC